MFESWTKWAVGEGLLKTTNRVFSKFLGSTSGTAEAVFIVTIVSAAVQTILGAALALYRKQALFPAARQIWGSIAFGFVATLMTVVGLLIFTFPGAEVGVVTFIVTLSIVPGILIDRIFFGDRLTRHQYLGIILFLISGWAMLGFISLASFLTLPTWVLIAFALMFLYPLNEFITRKLAVREKADPFVNNFWIGLSTIVFAFIGLLIFGSHTVAAWFDFGPAFWYVSSITGVVVVAMTAFKLLSYKDGSTIALKKLVMMGTQLLSAIVAGAVLFGESITTGKIAGVLIFFIAFFLADKNAWNFVRRFLPRLSNID